MNDPQKLIEMLDRAKIELADLTEQEAHAECEIADRTDRIVQKRNAIELLNRSIGMFEQDIDGLKATITRCRAEAAKLRFIIGDADSSDDDAPPNDEGNSRETIVELATQPFVADVEVTEVPSSETAARDQPEMQNGDATADDVGTDDPVREPSTAELVFSVVRESAKPIMTREIFAALPKLRKTQVCGALAHLERVKHVIEQNKVTGTWRVRNGVQSLYTGRIKVHTPEHAAP